MLSSIRAIIVEVFMEFNGDSQYYRNNGLQLLEILYVYKMYAQKMDVVQRSVIFHLRFKGEGSKRIHTDLVEAYGAGAYPIDSVKYWVKQYDGGRRDRTDLSKPDRPVSDVAEAVSQLLREESFSSTRHIAAQLRLSRTSVKRTLVSVLGMRKFSL
jgi:hypothetical protein